MHVRILCDHRTALALKIGNLTRRCRPIPRFLTFPGESWNKASLFARFVYLSWLLKPALEVYRGTMPIVASFNCEPLLRDTRVFGEAYRWSKAGQERLNRKFSLPLSAPCCNERNCRNDQRRHRRGDERSPCRMVPGCENADRTIDQNGRGDDRRHQSLVAEQYLHIQPAASGGLRPWWVFTRLVVVVAVAVRHYASLPRRVPTIIGGEPRPRTTARCRSAGGDTASSRDRRGGFETGPTRPPRQTVRTLIRRATIPSHQVGGSSNSLG